MDMKAQESNPLTERESQEKQRELEAREDRAIFDNAAVGIAFTRDRCFKRCNARFAQMFGYSEAELVGESAAVIYASATAYGALGQSARPVLAAGEDFQTEIELKRRDGSLFWCRLYGRAVDASNPRDGTVWITEDVTAQHRSETREAAIRVELEAVLDTAVVGIGVVRERVLQRCNRRFEEIFGCRPGAMVGQTTRIWYACEDDFSGIGSTAYQQLARGAIHRREQLMQRADGSLFWGSLSGRAFDPANVHAGSVWILEDISERKRQEAYLREALDEQEMIFENAAVGIMLVRKRTVLRCNRRLEALFGYAPGELPGQSTAVLHADKSSFEKLGQVAYARLERGETYSSERQIRRKDGSMFWVRGTAHRIREDTAVVAASGPDSAQGIAVIWIFEDITERRAMQDALLQAHEQLELRVEARTSELATANSQLQSEVFERMQAEARIWQIAHHDALTGLPNRSLLQDRLQQALVGAARGGRKVALLFIDLDRFKQINDTLGHDVGDIFLRGIADRIRAAVRSVDTVSRLGGDEFVVLLQDIEHHDDALLVAEKIRDGLNAPIDAAGTPLYPSASIGISLFPDDAKDAAELMRNADTAMYHAKAAGRNTFKFFAAQMNEDAARFFRTEQKLRGVLENRQLELYYQPWFDLTSGTVAGVEALLRWNHPERGLVLPAEFIPVAEETGMIVPIGDWVMRTACAQSVAWEEAGHGALPVAVNLSPRQFWKKSLVEDIRTVLAETGLPPERLEVDVTEVSLMRELDDTLAKLRGLADMGVRLAIDDFGTGHTSLSHLKRFPLHRLKIDRSFVADMCSGKGGAGIVVAIIGLARSLGLALIAEGVENEDQVAALMDYGCGLCQGFYFARPMPAGDLAALLTRS